MHFRYLVYMVKCSKQVFFIWLLLYEYIQFPSNLEYYIVSNKVNVLTFYC